MECGIAGSEGVTRVPFVQMVLHGTLYYTGDPLNTDGNINYAMLRCAEYGCLPGALLTYRTIGFAQSVYYADACPELAQCYIKLNSSLADLYGERITDHTMISDGVYCTEYGNSSLVYVNYTESDTEINGIRLEAGGFIRIN